MIKAILLMTFWWVLIGAGPSIAAISSSGCYYYYPNDIANATGTVTATGLNSITIDDEENKRLERFIYLEQVQPYHQGDYVRIYYHPRGKIVVRIKRMTVFKFKEKGQNLGNIFHQVSS